MGIMALHCCCQEASAPPKALASDFIMKTNLEAKFALSAQFLLLPYNTVFLLAAVLVFRVFFFFSFHDKKTKILFPSQT